jgi:hypothetical protein
MLEAGGGGAVVLGDVFDFLFEVEGDVAGAPEVVVVVVAVAPTARGARVAEGKSNAPMTTAMTTSTSPAALDRGGGGVELRGRCPEVWAGSSGSPPQAGSSQGPLIAWDYVARRALRSALGDAHSAAA